MLIMRKMRSASGGGSIWASCFLSEQALQPQGREDWKKSSQHVYEPERAITHATHNDAARQRTLQIRHQRPHRHNLHTKPTNPRQHLPLTKGPVTVKIQGKQLIITPTDKSLKQLTEKIRKIET